MGLETRGLRPDPAMRGLTAKFIYEDLDRYYRLDMPYVRHMMLHGVFCGPTISKILRGFDGILNKKFDEGEGVMDIHEWQVMLDELVDRVVEANDQEFAIEALHAYDHARKRMDRIQAVPPSRRGF
jgi:hypothetical protein